MEMLATYQQLVESMKCENVQPLVFFFSRKLTPNFALVEICIHSIIFIATDQLKQLEDIQKMSARISCF